ncbi:MAG: DOMON-like domain-containing protein [Steroidobacteraceae bacterium]
MEFAAPAWATLTRHTSTHSDAAHGIDAQAQVGEAGALMFRYVLRAEISHVRIPRAMSAERTDGLWKHTCFEAFIKAPGAAGYYELNFAPSRQWAVYRFNAYREGISSPDLDASPEISVRRFADRLEVDAAVCLHDLIGLQGTPHLRLALSAVVEEENGTLSYWALRHARGKADFHCPDGFVLELGM